MKAERVSVMVTFWPPQDHATCLSAPK